MFLVVHLRWKKNLSKIIIRINAKICMYIHKLQMFNLSWTETIQFQTFAI